MTDIEFSPEIAEKVKEVREAFSQPGADGTVLFEKLRDLLILQGEINFENETRNFPHGMEVPELGFDTFADQTEERMLTWLRETVGEDNFVFMPVSAQGKYKDKWNWIYFKDPAMAMLFKLTWL